MRPCAAAISITRGGSPRTRSCRPESNTPLSFLAVSHVSVAAGVVVARTLGFGGAWAPVILDHVITLVALNRACLADRVGVDIAVVVEDDRITGAAVYM
jgi:hypothetical protein